MFKTAPRNFRLKAIAVAVAVVFGIQCSAQETELHRAANEGDLRWVQHVLNSGVYVDATNGDGETPLDLAAEHGHADVVQVLLDAGARLERDALYVPALLCKVAVLQLLIDAGADPNAVNSDGDTALHKAAGCVLPNAAEVVLVLLNAGADPNAVNSDGETPLHQAAECQWFGSAEAVLVLLNAGADPNAINSDGETPLDWAIRSTAVVERAASIFADDYSAAFDRCADVVALLE